MSNAAPGNHRIFLCVRKGFSK